MRSLNAALVAGLAAWITTTVAKEFYVFVGNSQACPCIGGGLPCSCTNQAVHGIAPTDDFDCGSLDDKYIQPFGEAPPSCNNYPFDEVTMTVSGCRFGDDSDETGTIRFRETAFQGAFEVNLPDSDDPDAIYATCIAPSGCEVGDEDSELLFDSKTCLEGVGYETLVNAYYKCTDWEGISEDQMICP